MINAFKLFYLLCKGNKSYAVDRERSFNTYNNGLVCLVSQTLYVISREH